jgi:hypothetical protein
MKKILPLFQGIVNNEKESGFRWLLKQGYNLLRECRNKNPLLFITDYNTALINALANKFPQAKHYLYIFHININVILNIKKKWRKPGREELLTATEDENTTGSPDPEDPESDNKDFRVQNMPQKNTTMPALKVPALDAIPYTRTALFNLIKVIEFATDRRPTIQLGSGCKRSSRTRGRSLTISRPTTLTRRRRSLLNGPATRSAIPSTSAYI